MGCRLFVLLFLVSTFTGFGVSQVHNANPDLKSPVLANKDSHPNSGNEILNNANKVADGLKKAAKQILPQAQDLISESDECKEDLRAICPASSLGNNFKTLSCIAELQVETKFSPECHTYIWQYKKKMSEDENFVPMLASACATDIEKIQQAGSCGDLKAEDMQGHMVSCLIMHLDSLEDQDKCGRLVSRLGVIVFSDYRLLSSFYTSCSNDVTRLSCGSAQEDEQASHSQGEVIACLERNIKQVAPSCRKEINKVAELQAEDFNLDRGLYFACQQDREVLCSSVTAGEGRVYECLMNNKDSPRMSPTCQEALTVRAKMMVQDVRINYGLRESCLDDLNRFKGQCDFEEDDNEHSQMGRMLLCLEFQQRSGKPLNSKCVTQMKNVRKMLMSDYELNPSIVANCGKAIEEDCNGMEKGGKTLHCLMKLGKSGHLEESNPHCFKAIEFLIRSVNPMADASIDNVLMESCKPVISRACKDQNGNLVDDVIGCLFEKFDDKVMIPTCAEVLVEISYFANRDWALDRRLLRACASEARDKCHAEHWLTQKDSTPNGEVFACLYRHINHENTQTRLSSTCTNEVIRVMQDRAISVGLNPHLELACRADLAMHCSSDEITSSHKELECLQDMYEVQAMKNNGDTLTTECTAALKNYTKVETEEIEINRKLFKSCQSLINNYCKDEKEMQTNEGKLFECMVENKNEDDVEEACRAGIEHMQIIQLKDFDFDMSFKKSCRSDVTTYCSDSTTKDGVVTCLSKTIRDAKVRGQPVPISPECQARLYSALTERYEDVKLDREMFKVCKTDIKTYCANVKFGEARVLECLKDNKKKLSEECHAKIFEREEIEFESPDSLQQTDLRFAKKCRSMILRYCRDEEDTLKCLRKHRNEPDFDDGCKKMVKSRSEEQGEDVRLNPTMLMKCQSDIKTHCKAAIDSVQSSLMEWDKKPEELRGVIIQCLRQKFVEKKLSDECSVEVKDFIRASAQDFKMNLKLKTVCSDAISKLCPNKADHKVEECLKEAYMNGLMKSPADKECSEQIVQLLDEGHADISTDPMLQKTCSRDINALCPNVQSGNGRLIGCLVMQSMKSEVTMTTACRSMLQERLNMWKVAGDKLHDIESVGELMQKIGESPNRHIFLTVFFFVVSVIFVGGLVFGRITKRVAREMKAR